MSLKQRISDAGRCEYNQYPLWVREECRGLYRNGMSLETISELSGISVTTLDSWRRRGDGMSRPAWDDRLKPLEQPKRSRLVMPADAAGCLVVAAELLWLARGCRP